MTIKQKIILALTNQVFRLLKILLSKTFDDNLITDICEELLDLESKDKFIIGRSNCPICGEDFAGNNWSCHCFEEEDQTKWFQFMETITLEKRDYNFWFNPQLDKK